nr:MAG TPA: hypothetical protein [Caudoviricetes sp.]
MISIPARNIFPPQSTGSQLRPLQKRGMIR